MIDRVKERIKKRLSDEEINDYVMDEINQIVTDRLCLRLGVSEDAFPTLFESIVVDACVKAWRKCYYEGVSSEGVGSLSNTFIDDVLAEYANEIGSWVNANDSSKKRTVHFL